MAPPLAQIGKVLVQVLEQLCPFIAGKAHGLKETPHTPQERGAGRIGHQPLPKLRLARLLQVIELRLKMVARLAFCTHPPDQRVEIGALHLVVVEFVRVFLHFLCIGGFGGHVAGFEQCKEGFERPGLAHARHGDDEEVNRQRDRAAIGQLQHCQALYSQ